jgi:nitroreductase
VDTYETIISKRDLRQYTDAAIADDVLRRVLQAGRMAGSAKNIEPNRLVVVTDQQVKDDLALGGDFTSWIGSSSVIIGIAARQDDLRLFDTGRTAQNIMLAAHAEGLGTCPVTLQHQEVVRAAVGLPADWQMPMAITVGHPDPDAGKSPLARPRVPLDELVVHNHW